MIIPVNVTIIDDDIIFRTGDDKVVYTTEVNTFVENSGLTIKNVILPLSSSKVYYSKLSDVSQNYICGNGFKTNMLEIKKELNTDGILILDFADVEEVSVSFLSTYTKFLLESSNKIITINMSIEISNMFSTYILKNIIKDEEEEEWTMLF